MTMLPQNDAARIKEHLGRIKKLHEADLEAGYGGSICPMPSPASIRVRHGSGRGSMCFPRARARWTRVRDGASTLRTRKWVSGCIASPASGRRRLRSAPEGPLGCVR